MTKRKNLIRAAKVSEITDDVRGSGPTEFAIIEGLFWSARRRYPRRKLLKVVYVEMGGRRWQLLELRHGEVITLGGEE